MAKPKILLLTDSLAFPRCEPERVTYEETYIALLKTEFPQCDFIHHGRGGATIADLFKHSTYYHEALQPDLVFMHSGVVDCAPRALTVIEQQIISRLPVGSRLAIELVKKYSHVLRRARKMTYTSVEVFAQYVAKFESLFPKVYWIDILPALDGYELKLEGIQRNKALYSAILQRHRCIGTEQFRACDIMTDFHHLNRLGHHKMFMALSQVVRREFGSHEENPGGKSDLECGSAGVMGFRRMVETDGTGASFA